MGDLTTTCGPDGFRRPDVPRSDSARLFCALHLLVKLRNRLSVEARGEVEALLRTEIDWTVHAEAWNDELDDERAFVDGATVRAGSADEAERLALQEIRQRRGPGWDARAVWVCWSVAPDGRPASRPPAPVPEADG